MKALHDVLAAAQAAESTPLQTTMLHREEYKLTDPNQKDGIEFDADSTCCL
jgi:hypothetical protein